MIIYKITNYLDITISELVVIDELQFACNNNGYPKQI